MRSGDHHTQKRAGEAYPGRRQPSRDGGASLLAPASTWKNPPVKQDEPCGLKVSTISFTVSTKVKTARGFQAGPGPAVAVVAAVARNRCCRGAPFLTWSVFLFLLGVRVGLHGWINFVHVIVFQQHVTVLPRCSKQRRPKLGSMLCHPYAPATLDIICVPLRRLPVVYASHRREGGTKRKREAWTQQGTTARQVGGCVSFLFFMRQVGSDVYERQNQRGKSQSTSPHNDEEGGGTRRTL